MNDDLAKTDLLEGWATLLQLWPERCWEFGERLGVAIADKFAGVALAQDAHFIEDVMRATIAHIERLGFDFGSGVDVMILSDGARAAAGEIPRRYTTPACTQGNR